MAGAAAALAGAAAGAHALFRYNRENFQFDREMRRENEYQVLEWRNKQAEMWREDIRDIVGMTERKMDSYLLIGTLELTMCCGLFTEGRLEPGTPPWLLHLYMMTLGSCFMYLLMSMWFAMHASVIAQCSSVRLLTQFVRLPVPTWRQLEGLRTYGEAFENVSTKKMLRVPFVGSRQASGGAAPTSPQADGGAAAPPPGPGPEPGRPAMCDPWELEAHGDRRALYELQEMPAALRRHVGLARRASQQYQGFDAFSRVSLSFGTNQILHALTYYVLGYVGLQDGAPWAALCIPVIMVGISMVMVYVDVALTRRERTVTQVLSVLGPATTVVAVWARALLGQDSDGLVLHLLPITCASHCLCLLWALKTCGVKEQPNGSMLPTKFRAVLYLDVFGWLAKGQPSGRALRCGGYTPMNGTSPHEFGEGTAGQLDPENCSLSQLEEDLRDHISLWQSDKLQRVMDEHEKARVESLAKRFQAAAVAKGGQSGSMRSSASGRGAQSQASTALGSQRSQTAPSSPSKRWVKLHGYSDVGTEAPYFFDPESGDVAHTAHDSQQAGAVADGEPSNKNVRSITFAEEGVEEYCSRASSRRSTRTGPAWLGLPEEDELPLSAPESPERSGGPRSARSPVKWKGGFLGNPDDAAGQVRRALSCTVPRTLSFELSDEGEPKSASVGPSGALASAPDFAFEPSSYFAAEGAAAAARALGDSEIVTGLDRMKPGQLPWAIFRGATLLLVVLWALGVAGPLGLFQGLVLNAVTQELVMRGEGAVKSPRLASEYFPGIGLDLPALPEGELVHAAWPSHSGFIPRALGSDPSGRQLVVADDFGVYVGRLETGHLGSPEEGGRRLAPSTATKVLTARFHRAPACTALEGQAVTDIDVACLGDNASRLACHVLVLHSHGRRLSECPLPALGRRSAAGDPAAKPNMTWCISSDWLYSPSSKKDKEQVDSLAVNGKCQAETPGDGGMSHRAFHATRGGCLVVGTSSGRIVELRRHMTDGGRLVPERAVQQRSEGVRQGLLHFFPDGVVVVLRQRTGSVEAFEALAGRAIGEWVLPRGVDWLKISGGGGNLFLLARNGTDTQLYRFPVPSVLKQWQTPQANLRRQLDGESHEYAEI